MLQERVQMEALMKKRLISVVRRSKLNATCRSQKKNPIKQVERNIPEEDLCQRKDKSLTRDEMMLIGGEDRKNLLMSFVRIKVREH